MSGSRFFEDAATLNTSVVVTTSNQLGLPNATWASVTGLSFVLAANTAYRFSFIVLMQTDATTTGVEISVDGPLAPATLSYTATWWTGASTFSTRAGTAYDTTFGAGTGPGAVLRPWVVEGTIVTGAAGGTLIARVQKETAGTADVYAGSNGTLWTLS